MAGQEVLELERGAALAAGAHVAVMLVPTGRRSTVAGRLLSVE
jgi:hypothetical protein